MNWFALYTKTRHEDTVSARLSKAGIQVFNPKLKMKKFIRKQYRETIEPFFPCYVFARFQPDQHLWMISYTRGVKRIVGGSDGPWAVADEIIGLIRHHEVNGFIRIVDSGIREGDTVRIADGPFAGFQGIFQKPVKGDDRVVVLLGAIEYQAKVVVQRAVLMKVC